jgi:hybrid cluster-associated redox disulfide protein
MDQMDHQRQNPLRINSSTLIDTLIDNYPASVEVFIGFGMACVGCVFSPFHSVQDAAAVYQLDSELILDELHHKLALRVKGNNG